MTQCIKCGKAIPDGELFCAVCSKDPLIAELNGATVQETGRIPSTPVSKPVTIAAKQTAAAKKPAVKQTQKPSKTKVWLICVSVLLVLVLGILLFQQGKLQVERNRLRTGQDELERQQLHIAQTEQALSDTQAQLEQTEQQLKDKEQEIKTLTAQLAESRSSQNQGQYDMAQLEQELTTLQEEYDALQEEHDLMVEAVEAASGYKEKAEFLDKYVVFVVNDNSKRYHTYDCPQFTRSNFWTYSPKLAQAQGFKPCPDCIG